MMIMRQDYIIKMKLYTYKKNIKLQVICLKTYCKIVFHNNITMIYKKK